MREVDARGLSCPLPVMRTESAIVDEESEIRVLVDSGTARHNVSDQLRDAGYEVAVDEASDMWAITAKRS